MNETERQEMLAKGKEALKALSELDDLILQYIDYGWRAYHGLIMGAHAQLSDALAEMTSDE